MALKQAGFIICVLLLWGHAPSGASSDTTDGTLFSFNADFPTRIQESKPISVPLGFNISYQGFLFDNIIISADGTVSFLEEVKYKRNTNYSGVISLNLDVPFLAPLLYNGYRPPFGGAATYQGLIYHQVVNYNDPSVGQENQDLRERLSNFLTDAVINLKEPPSLTYLVLVTWSNVTDAETGECTERDPCKSGTFQLALTGNATSTFAIFNYGKIDIDVQADYQAGFNAGGGRGWVNVLPCQGGCGAASITNLRNFQGSDRPGRYVFSVGREMVIRGGCLDRGLKSGILEVFPRSVGMFGGERLEVSGMCGSVGDSVYCRFGGQDPSINRTVVGKMVTTMKGYCPVPLLSMTGRLDLFWSKDNREWIVKRSINVVLPTRLGDPVAVDPSVEDAWNKRDSKNITVKWDPAKFSKEGGARVDVKIIAYKERANQFEYQEIPVNSTDNSQGSFTFSVAQYRCTRDCDQYDTGLLEVSLSSQYHSTATERVAVRFGPISLGWYVNQALTSQRGADWSNQKCRTWGEAKDTQWLKELLPCPCSLDQAMADFGRWQADPSCDLFKGSRCMYHKGAKHCVRAIAPTSGIGAGNQCCYLQDGTLSYSQFSSEGSTPDRSHAWGSHPYNQPGRVPELAHWKQDVVPFYYCCLWNNNQLCDIYRRQRPTSDCRNYASPALGFVQGSTHIRTWDNQTYNFLGSGDYYLATSPTFDLHGKFLPRSNSWDLGHNFNGHTWTPTSLTALAVSSNNMKVVVTVAAPAVSHKRGIEIRVDGESRYFVTKASMWQDFEVFTIVNNAQNGSINRHNNFTILIHGINVGINVAAVNGLLHVVVAIPPTYKPTPGSAPLVTGLLGVYDESPLNDFRSRLSVIVSPQAPKRDIQANFALTWGVKKEDTTIFGFPNTALDHLDTQHLYLETSDIPEFAKGPAKVNGSSICGASENCRYDYQITNDRQLAAATKSADAWAANLQAAVRKVNTCGIPELGFYTQLTTYNFSENREVKVQGCTNGKSLQTGTIYRCVRETKAEASRNNRAGEGVVSTDPDTKTEYVTHWVPKPQDPCTEAASTGSGSNLGLIIGLSVGGAVLLIAIIVVVVIVVRKKKGKAETTSPKETRTAAPREKRDAVRDPRAAEAMLARVEDRSPVYKPSADQVRMSDVQGSNV